MHRPRRHALNIYCSYSLNGFVFFVFFVFYESIHVVRCPHWHVHNIAHWDEKSSTGQWLLLGLGGETRHSVDVMKDADSDVFRRGDALKEQSRGCSTRRDRYCLDPTLLGLYIHLTALRLWGWDWLVALDLWTTTSATTTININLISLWPTTAQTSLDTWPDVKTTGATSGRTVCRSEPGVALGIQGPIFVSVSGHQGLLAVRLVSSPTLRALQGSKSLRPPGGWVRRCVHLLYILPHYSTRKWRRTAVEVTDHPRENT